MFLYWYLILIFAALDFIDWVGGRDLKNTSISKREWIHAPKKLYPRLGFDPENIVFLLI